MERGSLERRVVSVLFADLVGFTSLSEELDAEDVAAVQERYFAAVREVIERHGGRLEKFIGDAAMAVFGVPRTRDDDAERATRAGLALINTVAGLSTAIGLPEDALRLRVGVNSGEVAFTPADGDDWRVSGDTVNVAARLQAAAAPGTVLLGDSAAFAVAEVVALDPPVELELKGKSAAVRAWRAATVLPSRSRERAMGNLRAPLLGRESELAKLTELLSRVKAGASETVIVLAPPGVGKTRLVEEYLRLAEADKAASPLIRRARLGPEMVSPTAAVAQLLSSVPPAGDAQLDDELARLLAEGQPPAGGTGLAATDLARERRLRFAAWIAGLDELAAGRPQLWLIEDIHWSSGDLLAFIELAARQPAEAGRLVLATARPALLDQLTGRAGEAPPTNVMELAPLDGSNAHALLDALVGEALPPNLKTAIVERSDGNPLFIEELLRAWVSVGTLVALEPAGAWRLDRELDKVALPQTVQAIYAGQLDDLPHGARRLVRRASVAGRSVPRNSLAALHLEDADEALAAALRRALLQAAPPDVVVGPSLSYRHALLRDAAYASLSRSDRASLHAALAAWYEAAAGERSDEVAEVIARHYGAALENSSKLDQVVADGLDRGAARQLAIGWYERAARQALAGAAHETARQLLSEAIAIVDQGDDLLRGRLLLSLGEATAYTASMDEGVGQMERALDSFRAALAAAAKEAERAEARLGYATAAAAIGRAWNQQLRFDDALHLAEATLALTGAPDDAGTARLLGLRAWVKSTLETDRSAVADIDHGLRIARNAADRFLELELLHWRAMALSELGDVTPADWRAVEDMAHELADWSRAAKALRMRAAWLVDDEPEQVWEIADRAEEICRRHGLEEDLAWIEYTRSEVGFAGGKWDAALDAGRRAIEIGERNAYHRVVVRTWHVLLPIAEARGDRALIEHAQRWFDARRGSLPDSPYARLMYWAFESRFIRAGLRPPSTPDPATLLPSFEGEPGGPSTLSAIEDVIELWLAEGHLEAAGEALARCQRALDEASDATRLARGCVLYLRARLASVGGVAGGAAEPLVRSALEHLRAIAAPWWIAKCLRLLAELGQATEAEVAEWRALLGELGVSPA